MGVSTGGWRRSTRWWWWWTWSRRSTSRSRVSRATNVKEQLEIPPAYLGNNESFIQINAFAGSSAKHELVPAAHDKTLWPIRDDGDFFKSVQDISTLASLDLKTH